MNANEKLANSTIGPGGFKCVCCGPAPKHRAAHRRMVRARLNRMAQKEAREALAEVE